MQGPLMGRAWTQCVADPSLGLSVTSPGVFELHQRLPAADRPPQMSFPCVTCPGRCYHPHPPPPPSNYLLLTVWNSLPPQLHSGNCSL